MSQAYTTLDEWEVFSSAFEKFSSMVATLHDAQAPQLDHGQVEKFLDMSGRELALIIASATLSGFGEGLISQWPRDPVDLGALPEGNKSSG